LKKFQEGDVIARFVEQRAASVATIQDVVGVATLRSATIARHGEIVEKDKMTSSEK